MDNPEKLATYTRQTKQKHNTVCVGHHSGLIAIQQGFLPRGSNKCRTTV